MPKKKRKKDLRETIRASLTAGGGTVYELAASAQSAGVCHRSTVYRYMTEGKAVSSDVAEWIIDHLGLRVVSRSD